MINVNYLLIEGGFIMFSRIYYVLVLTLLFSVSLVSASFKDDSIDTNKLSEVWNSNKKICKYYDFVLNDVHFSGRRDWSERWAAIKRATSFSNKKVLDLGSHIGINSIFIAKYLSVKSLVSVERRPAFIDMHEQLMRVFNVSYKVVQLDFEKDNFEDILGYNYDVVFCLSLLRWIKSNKTRFLEYLSNFSEIVLEGHPDQEDIATFKKYGFTKHKILAVTSSNQANYKKKNRPIIIFSK